MHFYESSIITTKDGLHCQVYGNEHPVKGILVKPKYIPTDKIACDALQCRFIAGKKMNRLSMWSDKASLAEYISKFKQAYPHYVYESELHDKERLFFWVPVECIERIYFPRRGLSELMSMPEKSLDEHLKVAYNFTNFLLGSGLRLKDFGITYSTLMGHYMSNLSDINMVVYGKENFWKLMAFLKEAKHPSLRWKSEKEWMEFYNKRNRFKIFDSKKFLWHAERKKSEGYFKDSLFVIFAAEREEETWFKWGQEKYSSLGLATVEGIVEDSHSSVVRPGCYTVKEAKITDGPEAAEEIEKIVFYSRDYSQLALPGERICARGLLEKVEPKKGEPYCRVVTGYLDAYITGRREQEFIKVM